MDSNRLNQKTTTNHSKVLIQNSWPLPTSAQNLGRNAVTYRGGVVGMVKEFLTHIIHI